MAISNLMERYCCCNIIPLIYGIYLIGIHSFIHGCYGIVFIITSSYRNYSKSVNYSAIVSQGCFIPAGIAAVWTGLYESSKGAMICKMLFLNLSISNFVSTLWYFIHYFDFEANSAIDKGVLWRNDYDWVESDQVPFTFWHLFAFGNVLATGLWIYYTVVIYMYRKAIRADSAQRT